MNWKRVVAKQDDLYWYLCIIHIFLVPHGHTYTCIRTYVHTLIKRYFANMEKLTNNRFDGFYRKANIRSVVEQFAQQNQRVFGLFINVLLRLRRLSKFRSHPDIFSHTLSLYRRIDFIVTQRDDPLRTVLLSSVTIIKIRRQNGREHGDRDGEWI